MKPIRLPPHRIWTHQTNVGYNAPTLAVDGMGGRCGQQTFAGERRRVA